MAYGAEASLKRAIEKIDRLSEKLGAVRLDPEASEARKLVSELLCAVAYLADGIRYLKDGVR
jgi:hypothetical protein